MKKLLVGLLALGSISAFANCILKDSTVNLETSINNGQLNHTLTLSGGDVQENIISFDGKIFVHDKDLNSIGKLLSDYAKTGKKVNIILKKNLSYGWQLKKCDEIKFITTIYSEDIESVSTSK